MSYSFYKLLHLVGVFLLFIGFGGLIARQISRPESFPKSWRKLFAISHGIGLALLLVAGFGLLARLGTSWPWPGWVWLKVALWLLLGAMIALIARAPKLQNYCFGLVVILGILAAYVAIYKPF